MRVFLTGILLGFLISCNPTVNNVPKCYPEQYTVGYVFEEWKEPQDFTPVFTRYTVKDYKCKSDNDCMVIVEVTKPDTKSYIDTLSFEHLCSFDKNN